MNIVLVAKLVIQVKLKTALFHLQVEMAAALAESFCYCGEIIELFDDENNLFIIFAFKFKS